MSGTSEGGKKTIKTIKLRYGSDYFIRLGSIGGKMSQSRPFRDVPGLAREAGRKGGLAASRNRREKSLA